MPGNGIGFIFAHLEIIPQDSNQAAASLSQKKDKTKKYRILTALSY